MKAGLELKSDIRVRKHKNIWRKKERMIDIIGEQGGFRLFGGLSSLDLGSCGQTYYTD